MMMMMMMVMMQMTIMVTLMNKINRGLLYGFHFERFEEMEREFFCKFFFVFFNFSTKRFLF